MEVYVKLPLDDPLGSLMLATFFGCMLYSHEVVLMLQYFRSRPADSLLPAVLMAGLFANDTFAMANEIYTVDVYCISNWGNVAFLAVQGWTIAAFCVTAGISASACQAFLVVRVHRFARKWWLTAPLALTTAAALAGALWAAYEETQIKLLTDRARGNAAVSMWLIAAAVADAGIAGVLLVFLWRARRVARQFEGSALVGPLTQMMLLTVETGGLTALIAVIALSVYLKDPSSNASVGLGFTLGRLYTLTVLFCLAQRGSGQREGAFSNSSGQHTSAFAHKARTLGGVSVTHQATVVIEERDEHELAEFAARSGAGQRKQAAFATPPAKLYMIGSADEDEVDEKRSYGRHDSV